MQEKSRLLPAGQTRNRSKSPVHHILLAVTLVLLCSIAVPQSVQASRPPTFFDMGKKTTATISLSLCRPDTYQNTGILDIGVLVEAKKAFTKDYQKKHPGATSSEITSAYYKAVENLTFKNTKPSILKASLSPENVIFVDLKKTGKTTITVKGKLGKKNINIKIIVNVNKYERPFTSFKINGKSYSDAFKDLWSYDIHKWNQSTKTLKLQLKPKKGWTLQSVEYKNSLYPYWKIAKKSSTTLNYNLITPNKNSITSTTCWFKLYNKKNNQTIEYTVRLQE